MKKLVLAAAAVTFVSGAAMAADLPTAKGPPPAPVVYAPAFTWTGFYVGINAGGAWRDSNNGAFYLYDPQYSTGNNYSLPYIYSSGGNDTGWLIGGTVGYNYQFGVGSGFVVGIEADLDYLSSGNDNRSAFLDCTAVGCGPDLGQGGYGGTYFGYGSGGGNNYFGTVRARLGWAFDHFLVYATGGLAYGGNSDSGIGAINWWARGRYGANAPDATFFAGRSSSDDWGWTIGAGAEYAITNNWTIKAEYLYVSQSGGNNNNAYVGCYSSTGAGAAACGRFTGANAYYWYNQAKNDNNANIVRVGVNYKF